MKNTLLMIAIFLAVLMNGVLLYEISCGKPTITAAAAEIKVDNQVPLASAPVAQNDRTMEILVVPAPQEWRCYTRWSYKPGQPVRNLVRYFHNVRMWRWAHRC